MNRSAIFFLFAFCLFTPVCATWAQTSKSYTTAIEKLNLEIQKLKTDTDLLHASWSICVTKAKTGLLLTEYNSETSLAPASTQKILTTAAGLSLLGPDFTYKTNLEYDGTFDSLKGIITGNLYIRGSGDPTLESAYFKDPKDSTPLVNKWAEILKTKGIHSIQGSIIADATAFEDEGTESNWVWGDMGNYYGAGASGLSYKDNLYTLYFKSGKEGDTTGITKILPDIPGFSIKNYVRAGGTEDQAYIYGEPYNNSRYVNGSIPPDKNNFGVRGSLPDPPLLLATDFRRSLQDAGISVQGQPITIRQLKLANKLESQPRTKIYTHTSPSLEKIVYWTNMVSNNLFAETILKTIAFRKNKFGTSEQGIEELVKFWKSKGIDTKGLFLHDGCGMARANALTGRQLCEILRTMTQDPYYQSFYNSLPIAGKSGTMKGLLKGTPAENNMRAKSGSFNRARSFAGYVNTKSGDQLCFSIIANNFDCSSNEMRKKMEKLMELIAEL